MTGCMYVAPITGLVGGQEATQPLVMADTIVTIEDSESPHFILPSNATPENINNLSKGILYRKVYIVNDLCAVAFSGRRPKIEECYKSCLENMPFWLQLEKPIEHVQNVANNLLNDLDDIAVVGAAIKPELRQTNFITPPGRPYQFEHLGTCYITGSGKLDLLRNASEFNQQMKNSGSPPDGIAAHWFATDANAVRLAEEVNGNIRKWGGYIEYAYLDRATHRWLRGPRTLHVFMNVEFLPGDHITLRDIPRLIAYDPGPEIGRLVSVLFDPKVDFMYFSLKNLLQESEHTNVPPIGFWDSWFPQIVTITVILNDEIRGTQFINRTLEGNSLYHFNCSLYELGPYYNVSNDVLDDLGNIVANACGRQYQPLRETRA